MISSTLIRLRRALLCAAAAALILTTTALAGSGVGGVFNLGQVNTVNATSTLSGTVSGPQLRVQNTSTAASAFSLYGLLTATSPAGNSAAVRGQNNATNALGYGVYGSQAGSGIGVFGFTPSGVGVQGQTNSAAGAGVVGRNTAAGPALKAIVPSNAVAPISVNSTHVVPNLHAANSDALGGVAASAYQRRVTGSCSAHQAMRVVNADGTVACESFLSTPFGCSTDQAVQSYTAGTLVCEGFLPTHATADDSSHLGGKSASAFWQLGGNATAPSTGVLGTTDNQALELAADNSPALRIEPNTTSGAAFPDAPNLIGGSKVNGNSTNNGAYALTIGGGGDSNYPNQVTDNYGTIGGGYSNVAGDVDNDPGSAEQATVGGGAGNIASASSATVAGGDNNTASAQRSTVSGGSGNHATGFSSVVAGGGGNTASATDSFAAGGSQNTASGAFSFAAGRQAKATQNGSFVWGDSTAADVTSPAPDTFTVRAGGGTFIKGSANVSGGALSTGVATFTAGATAPSVSGGNVFQTSNGNPTTITNFTGGAAGQIITLVFGDSVTTVQNNGSVFLQGATNFTPSQHDTLTLVNTDGSKWYEVSRSANH